MIVSLISHMAFVLVERVSHVRAHLIGQHAGNTEGEILGQPDLL